MKCVGYWKENLKSYLITYDELDPFSKYRCWVYQRADLNKVLMSQGKNKCMLNIVPINFCFYIFSYWTILWFKAGCLLLEFHRGCNCCNRNAGIWKRTWVFYFTFIKCMVGHKLNGLLASNWNEWLILKLVHRKKSILITNLSVLSSIGQG